MSYRPASVGTPESAYHAEAAPSDSDINHSGDIRQQSTSDARLSPGSALSTKALTPLLQQLHHPLLRRNEGINPRRLAVEVVGDGTLRGLGWYGTGSARKSSHEMSTAMVASLSRVSRNSSAIDAID